LESESASSRLGDLRAPIAVFLMAWSSLWVFSIACITLGAGCLTHLFMQFRYDDRHQQTQSRRRSPVLTG